jgi:hypothetical protein
MTTCHNKLLHSMFLACSLQNLFLNRLFTNEPVDSNLHHERVLKCYSELK